MGVRFLEDSTSLPHRSKGGFLVRSGLTTLTSTRNMFWSSSTDNSAKAAPSSGWLGWLTGGLVKKFGLAADEGETKPKFL
jgi:hypothetical protein